VLDGVEDRRDVLRLVDDDRGRAPAAGQGTAPRDEPVRVAQVLRAQPRLREVEPDGGIGEERPEQGGLAGLPGAEDQVDVGRPEPLRPRLLHPSTERHADLIIVRRF
jgi:hypothetical protein